MHSRSSRLWLAATLGSLLAACGGGGGGGGGGNVAQQPPQQRTFIAWAGSTNGSLVVDASNDLCRFFSDTRTMEVYGTELVNTFVDNSAYLIWNGLRIGSVAYIRSTANTVITGLVSNAGSMIDVYEQNGQLYWVDSHIIPVFASWLEPDEEADGDQTFVAQEWEATTGFGMLYDEYFGSLAETDGLGLLLSGSHPQK